MHCGNIDIVVTCDVDVEKTSDFGDEIRSSEEKHPSFLPLIYLDG